jgi:hypothetical protein
LHSLKTAHFFRPGNTYHLDPQGNYLPILPRGDPNKPRAKPRFSVADLKPGQGVVQSPDLNKTKRDDDVTDGVGGGKSVEQISPTNKSTNNRTFELAVNVTEESSTTLGTNKNLSDKLLSSKKLTDNQLSDKEKPIKKDSSKELSDKQLSDKKLSNKQLSDKQLSDKQLSNKQLSDKQLSDKQLSDKQLSDKGLPNKQVSNKKVDASVMDRENLEQGVGFFYNFTVKSGFWSLSLILGQFFGYFLQL